MQTTGVAHVYNRNTTIVKGADQYGLDVHMLQLYLLANVSTLSNDNIITVFLCCTRHGEGQLLHNNVW